MSKDLVTIHDKLHGKTFTGLEYILGYEGIVEIMSAKINRYQHLNDLLEDALTIKLFRDLETGEYDTSSFIIQFPALPHSEDNLSVTFNYDDRAILYIDDEKAPSYTLEVPVNQVQKIRSWIK